MKLWEFDKAVEEAQSRYAGKGMAIPRSDFREGAQWQALCDEEAVKGIEAENAKLREVLALIEEISNDPAVVAAAREALEER